MSSRAARAPQRNLASRNKKKKENSQYYLPLNLIIKEKVSLVWNLVFFKYLKPPGYSSHDPSLAYKQVEAEMVPHSFSSSILEAEAC